jgi:hypothetical protein
MQCRFDSELLQQYVDRTIGALETVFVEEQLKVCPHCQTIVAELRWLAECLPSLHTSHEVEEELAELAHVTAATLCSETKGMGLTELIKQQLAIANSAASFLKHVPGIGALKALGIRGLKSAPKATWQLSRGLFMGGVKLARVLV